MIAAAARRLGCTEGQVYTLVTGLVVASLLTVAGAHKTIADDIASLPPITSPAAQSVPRVDPGQPPLVAGPSTPLLASPELPGVAAGGSTPVSSPGTPAATPTAPRLVATPALFARIGRPGAPGGVAVAPNGMVFVSTNNGTARGVPGPSTVFTLDRTGREVAGMRVTGQQSRHADGLGAVAVDPADREIYVVDIDSSRVLRVDPKRRTTVVATTVPDLPPCVVPVNPAPCEPGIVDHAPSPTALAFDPAGDLFVADAAQDTIWRWRAKDEAPAPWYQSNDITTGDGPAGLAFDRGNHLVFTVGSTLDFTGLNDGVLYGLNVNADGSAGARTLIAAFSSTDKPGAIVAAGVGDYYVILRGTGTIASVRQGTAKAFPTSGTPVPLDGPSGLALAGHRLLVSNQSNVNNAGHWAVLSFPLAP